MPPPIEWLKPWLPVEDGAGLEAELARELAPAHRLFGRRMRAIGRRGDCDDVLFADDALVAVVHLTWRGAEESDPRWPSTTIYADLEEWVEDCMKAEHALFFGSE